jgi:hypothetical protein
MRALGCLVLALAALGWWGALLPAADPAPNLEEWRRIEQKCLDCHKDPDLCGSRPDGRMRSVSVDPARYRSSVHAAKDLTCLHCHPGATVDHHPREGVAIEACGSCHDHEDELAAYRASRHGALLARKTPNAPDCFHCHSNHYTMAKTDPAALVHPDRIRETCGACHATEARSAAAPRRWAGARFSAHGKADFSLDYSTTVCTRCHRGPDTHERTPAAEPSPCLACHGPSAADPRGAAPLAVGPVHAGSDRNLGGTAAVARAAGLAVVLAVLAIGAGGPGLRWLHRKRQTRGAKPPDAAPKTEGNRGP